MPLCKFWPDDGHPCIYAPDVCAVIEGEIICAWQIARDGADDQAEREWIAERGYQPYWKDENEQATDTRGNTPDTR